MVRIEEDDPSTIKELELERSAKSRGSRRDCVKYEQVWGGCGVASDGYDEMRAVDRGLRAVTAT